ncbi:uncharacterized protein LDX57_006367 [Aspergillus melleus]|uniref:uncharacterized protein n=1 Tax=Aspergillus melleus TaxID=138277 RepID=UPI001E8D494B|nr:uncharacterized protein LDX57_006367 [Aspergillus melleus]KAH8428677.1 hypothetical protein LDX57_006367 [Aspergillus melleus]
MHGRREGEARTRGVGGRREMQNQLAQHAEAAKTTKDWIPGVIFRQRNVRQAADGEAEKSRPVLSDFHVPDSTLAKKTLPCRERWIDRASAGFWRHENRFEWIP